MGDPARKPLPPAVWEVLAAAAILAWRIRVHPVSTLWLDWIVALAAFWIFTALAGRTRAWPWVMGAVMTGLLALYAGHQVPLTLGLLGALR